MTTHKPLEGRADSERRKGFKEISWKMGGKWTQGKNLRYLREYLGADPENGTLVLVVHYEPGCEVGVHHHECDYCSIIVEGTINISHVDYGVGHMRFVKAGTVYGPLIAGPEGCTVIDIFAVGSDPESARNTYINLEARRAKRLEDS